MTACEPSPSLFYFISFFTEPDLQVLASNFADFKNLILQRNIFGGLKDALRVPVTQARPARAGQDAGTRGMRLRLTPLLLFGFSSAAAVFKGETPG